MTIALFAIDSAPLEGIVSTLVDEGLDVRAIDLNSLRGLQSLGPEISKGVLIISKHGAGEPTEWISRLITSERRLILCAPKPDSEGYQLLKEMGATEIITPRTADPAHISERILAQLIVDGDVEEFTCGSLFGATRVMRDLYRRMTAFAELADPVLILGETGTGKELVAKEIHKLSNRPDTFLSINCGELSRELAGSELFGHKRGSFTGATEARRGLVAEAGGGTIFLDEIGDLELKTQAFLMRVLEEKKLRRLGSNQREDAPARVVLATNRDLEAECEQGRFRYDLFERIRGLTLELTPLRERRADIPLLVHHFLTEFNQEVKRCVQMPDGALDCLFAYEWIGNVRELRSAVRNAAAQVDSSSFINIDHLIQATRRTHKRRTLSQTPAPENAKHYVSFDPEVDNWEDFLKRAEIAYFQAMWIATNGNKKEASRRSNLSLSHIYDKFNKLKSNE
jgi:DNA-binding NtrC family response regulator